MRITFITPRYPNRLDVTAMSFVQQLVWSIADLGHDCTVISPTSFIKKIDRTYEEKTTRGNSVKVYLPKTIHMGQRQIASIRTSRFTTAFFYQAVRRIIKKIQKQDIVYGHFGSITFSVGLDKAVTKYRESRASEYLKLIA